MVLRKHSGARSDDNIVANRDPALATKVTLRIDTDIVTNSDANALLLKHRCSEEDTALANGYIVTHHDPILGKTTDEDVILKYQISSARDQIGMLDDDFTAAENQRLR